MTDAECDENLDFRKPDTFCTFERAERNVCHGDSGGGVTTSLEGRHYLVGLVSFGTSCTDLAMGSRAEAQVHTDLAYYTADIDEFLNMKVEDRKERWEKSKSS
uniref:Peptidase S1 domain-containing protein n=1 Tax=Angiostrongylus cantonensis TaxID=6313 RepID=A0A0K0DNV6_ANGCA